MVTAACRMDVVWRSVERTTLPFDDKFRIHRREEVRAESANTPQAGYLRRSERGEGKLKTIFFLAVFAALIFIGFRTLPAYVAEYQLADKMQETARFAVVTRQSEEGVRDTIFKVIQDLNIPCKKEDIKVTSTGSLVTIAVDYRVPVDLIIYQTELHFTPTSENKSLV